MTLTLQLNIFESDSLSLQFLDTSSGGGHLCEHHDSKRATGVLNLCWEV